MNVGRDDPFFILTGIEIATTVEPCHTSMDRPVSSPSLWDRFAHRTSMPFPLPVPSASRKSARWKTWQLVIAVVVAAVVGMAINDNVEPGVLGAPVARARRAAAPTPCHRREEARRARPLPPQAVRLTTSAPTAGSATTSTTAGEIQRHHDDDRRLVHLVDDGLDDKHIDSPGSIAARTTQLQGNWTIPAFTITAPGWISAGPSNAPRLRRAELRSRCSSRPRAHHRLARRQ